MSRVVLSALFASVLASCGGGGGGPAPDSQVAAAPSSPSAQSTPQASGSGSTQQTTTPATAPVTPQPSGGTSQPVVQPQAQQPDPVAVASASCTYTNAFGAVFPCDPRWPHPGVRPPNGSTQDQVDGYNAMCSTMTCTVKLCPDGRVVGLSESFGVCPAQASQ